MSTEATLIEDREHKGEGMNAMGMMGRINLRQHRAMRLVAALMHELSPVLPEDKYVRRDVYDVLTRTLSAEGIEIVTDADREALGLPPRGPDGWTAEEIVTMERRRLDEMLRPISMIVPKEPAHDDHG
jgi:hypothetical protein